MEQQKWMVDAIRGCSSELEGAETKFLNFDGKNEQNDILTSRYDINFINFYRC